MARHLNYPQYYYALTDFDLSYKPEEFDWVRKRWNEGASIEQITKEVVKKFNKLRVIDEVVLLIFDMSYNELIQPREGGIWGNL